MATGAQRQRRSHAELNLKNHGTARQLSGTLSKPAEDDAKPEEIRLSQVAMNESQLGFRFEGKCSVRMAQPEHLPPYSRLKAKNLTLLGTVVWSDGTSEKLLAQGPPNFRRRSCRQAEQKGAKSTKSKAKSSKAEEGATERRT